MEGIQLIRVDCVTSKHGVGLFFVLPSEDIHLLLLLLHQLPIVLVTPEHCKGDGWKFGILCKMNVQRSEVERAKTAY